MIKKIKQLSIYATINGAFLYCVWQGAVIGNEGLMNVAIGFSIIMFLISVFFLGLCSNKMFFDKLKESHVKHIVPVFIDVTYDIAITSMLFSSGHIVIGIMYLFQFIAILGIKSALKNDTTDKL